MADGATTTPKQVQLLVNGVPILGRSGGQYLSFAYAVENFVENVGIDGEGFFAVNANLSGRAVVSLQQSSQSNDYLSRLFLAQRDAPGSSAWPVVLTEKNGTTKYFCAAAKIVKFADVAFSDAGEVRVWSIAGTRWDGFVGGLPITPTVSP